MNRSSYEWFAESAFPLITNVAIFMLSLVIIFNLFYFYKLKTDFKQFENNKKLFFFLLISGIIAFSFLLFIFIILINEKLNYNPQELILGFKKMFGN
ncbi:MAG: hypothetical protein RSA91_01850 [Bacilli bacterium]